MPARFGGDVATAALLAPQSGNGTGLVLPLGDSQYQCGELANYRAAGAGYYQYFVVLNTTARSCRGGCSGAQLTWLKADLDEDWGPATGTTATPGCRPSWSGPGAAR